MNEIHEHPLLNGQQYTAVWAYAWSSNGSNITPPVDCPIICSICGKVRGV